MTGLILKFGFFYGTFGLSVVKDWDTDAESDGVVPSVFHLLAEGEVASAGMVGTDTGCQADAGQISRFGDSDPQFRCLYTELACLYFRAEGYSGTKDIRFGGEGRQYIFVTQCRQIDLHFLFAVQFEELLQLQLIVLKCGLCGHQLITVGADLGFQLGIVAPGNASRIQQLFATVPLGFGYLQGVFVHLD